MEKRKGKPVFKEYTQGQIVLLPRDLEEEIEADHLVRVVNKAIEKMDLRVVYEEYAGGGTSSYHPKMLLKVLVYAYSQQIYSSRKIAKALRENIHFMWLSGNSQPDFHTINRFRGVVVKKTIGKIFAAVLRILSEGGYVKLENYFLDGTKMEANASKYSFVWSKNTKRYKEQVQEKVNELLEEIEEINETENKEYGEEDLPERGGKKGLNAEQLEKRIKELNEQLRQMGEGEAGDKEPEADSEAESSEKKAQPAGKRKSRARHPSKRQKMVKGIEKLTAELPKLKKYEEQERILGARNSYAKTDHDATFMRMKEDQMRNGQLKAGYNVQIGTEDQFILGYSIHQRPGDPTCLIPHMEESQQQRGGRQPQNVSADSAYGSEENYLYLEKENMTAYVKYNTFHQESKPRHKPNPFMAENMAYDESLDVFICPNQKQLHYKSTHQHHTSNGFESERRVYACENCSQCPLKEKCTKAVGNREIQVSFHLRDLRARAKERLLSEQGTALRKQRSTDVETVFGRIKQDWGFRRFLLRGLEKVKAEWALLCIAHNLTKMAVA